MRKCAIGNTGVVVFYPYSIPTGLPTFRPYGTAGNAGVVCFLPTSRPYGTPENNGSFVFYPHSVPTGLREMPGSLFSTHIPSLRDFGKHRGRCFLPTFHPYGTAGNTGVVVFYPHSVPTGLREIPGLLFSTHIPSLRESGKYRGRCFLPTFRPYGSGLLKTTASVFSTYLVSLRDCGRHRGRRAIAFKSAGLSPDI